MSRWALAMVAVAVAAGASQVSPIVRGDEVTFVAVGDPSNPPRIVADFNGWEGGAMTATEDGRTYTLKITLDAAARIEYLIAYHDRFVVDPRNPLTVPAPAGEPRSELRMPQYQPPVALPPPRARGTIEEVPFVSRSGERRRIRMYAPATTSRPDLPVLYVHDGDTAFGPLGLPSILDSLISAGRMAPVFVAFIDAVDRHDDYAPGSSFRSVFTAEIVPMLEARYRIARDRRALMGLSRSTVGALDTCANGSIPFEACALMAPAIPSSQLDTVLPAAGAATRLFIETGKYDIPLVTDARALRRALERRGVPVHYVESPEGHNHTAFRSRMPDLLEQLFPMGRAPRRPLSPKLHPRPSRTSARLGDARLCQANTPVRKLEPPIDRSCLHDRRCSQLNVECPGRRCESGTAGVGRFERVRPLWQVAYESLDALFLIGRQAAAPCDCTCSSVAATSDATC